MACMEIYKLDAVLDSWLIIRVLFINNCSMRKKLFSAEIGAKRSINGQNRTVRWHRLVQSDTVFLADRNLDRTVRDNYGRYRNYGPKSNFTA